MEVLTYLAKNRDNFDFRFDFFSMEDVSLFGKINAVNVKDFVKKKFDILFYFDYEPNILLEPVLVMSQAKCRVGRFAGEGKSQLFELMVQVARDAPISELIEQLHHYTKVFAANDQ